ncbi:hypothetical protein EVG20_g2494 [Dentipellis fragilis]|uniref:Uncharacterized protein n=1 Tax=Dentipellis fragilis TaxID=205917 RepID=A0A4Y9ZAW3_9AGAM|nr:hypothetical protein EVG20_g2494 [Dentipellis fragilis]
MPGTQSTSIVQSSVESAMPYGRPALSLPESTVGSDAVNDLLAVPLHQQNCIYFGTTFSLRATLDFRAGT